MTNIISLNTVQKEQEKGYIRIEYTDATAEVIQCDSFGLSDELTGFLVLWSDSSEEMIGFINSSIVKKIIIIKERLSDNG